MQTMSLKTSLLKTAIKWTPNKMIVWAANIVLKDIAKLSEFDFDLDTRKAYVQATLHGETEAIEVWMEGFAIVSNEGSHRLILQEAKSNRAWLNNLLARIVGKEWKIPAIPKFQSHIDLIVELLQPESPEQEADLEQEHDLIESTEENKG
jgi:hypothetical protein